MDSKSIQEILEAGKALGNPIQLDGHRVVIIVPEGYKLEQIPEINPALLPYIKQVAMLSDAESFISYVKRYKTINTVVFATLPKQDGTGGEFRAVFDYHGGGKGGESTPQRTAHQAFFPCPLSQNWQIWASISGKGMSQEGFVNFIESNTPDITSPDAAALMEMAINFSSKTEVHFLSKMDRKTGTRTLNFSEVVNDAGDKQTGSLTVPESLGLRLPVFEAGKAFDLQARLEWRPAGGKLTITVHLLRTHDVIRKAISELRSEIATGVDIEPMTGALK